MGSPDDPSSATSPTARDPVFGLEPPLVFAHRGGAGEVPEGTEEAFRWAVRHGTDVLELDVQLTRDGTIVIWHGPGLGIVHDGTQLLGDDVRIWDRSWDELEGRAWVVPPGKREERTKAPERQLLSLEDFLELVQQIEEERGDGRRLPLNIEIKPSEAPAPGWSESDERGRPIWECLFDFLDPELSRRTIVLASADAELLGMLRASRTHPNGLAYPTNLSRTEQLAYLPHMRTSLATILARGRSLVRSVFTNTPSKPESLDERAFQTSWKLVSRELCEVVHAQGGGVYAFLTGFSRLLPAIDDAPTEELRAELARLRAWGVDGVMTDYPKKAKDLL